MADPWADDWGDDWTKTAKPKAADSKQIWTQANDIKSAPVALAAVAPGLAYKPPLKILKREVAPVAAKDPNAIELTPAEKAQVAALEKSAREQRYKEARERLFGAPETTQNGSLPTEGRGTIKLQSPVPTVAPARQARGPEGDGRRGFAGRGRGRNPES